MRVMVLVKASEESESGVMPKEEGLAAMGAYNEELVKAGVMLDGDGLHPSSRGFRVAIADGETPSVTDGPFAESKELVAGYWMWQVKDLDEAREWARRIRTDRGRRRGQARGRGRLADRVSALIAGLARLTGDLDLAEDLAQEALVAALGQWPESGIPDNPGAWLTATAKHRGIDRLRRARTERRKSEELGHELQVRAGDQQRDLAAELDDPFAALEDDLLRLIFTTCHPVLSTEARVALTLRLVGG